MPSIHPDARIECGVSIAESAIVGAGVEIGRGSIVLDGAVLGRIPRGTATMTRPIAATGPLVIGRDCVIGANAVLYAGSTYGDRVLVSDLASLREGCTVGADTVLGRAVLVMYGTRIGVRCRVIDGAILTGNMVIESDVFIGPGANSINDNRVYLSRFGLESLEIRGPTIRRLALIGAGANLAAGIEVGEGAIVAPCAMACCDVPPWTVVAGVPAKKVRDVPGADREKILAWLATRESQEAE
jgi:acetyltransferase-like isoleucine patch superfamily enzyme